MIQDKIKALIDLIDKEPQFQRELKAQLAKIIKSKPQQFKEVISKDYGGTVPLSVTDVINYVHRESLTLPFKWFFGRRTPDLMKGVSLIAKFINPGISDAKIVSSLNTFKKSLSEDIETSYDIFHKAEVFESSIFGDFKFKLENLSNDPRLLSLPDIVQKRKTTAFGMAVLYVLLARDFDIMADITDVAGKPIVRFRDGASFEPLYIDIIAKGQFVSEDECHIYASSRGLEWSSSLIKPMTDKQIIKRMLTNLVYVYSKTEADPQNSSILTLLREFLKIAAE